MGHRLSKIYTRTGDSGTTGHGDRSRTTKHSLHITTITDVDAPRVADLEQHIDAFNAELEPLKDFILPGGTRAAALTHLARAICRRAERAVVSLAGQENVSEASRQYLNRLSDLLFVLGRALNRAAGRGDVLWRKDRTRQ